MSPAVDFKKPLWIGMAILGVAALAAAYFAYRGRPAPPPPPPVVVPQPGNPIEAAPDLNPATRANPFEHAYQNPFQ